MATRSGAIEIAQSSSLPCIRNTAWDGWSNFRPHIADLQQKAYGKFRSFRIGNPFEKGIDISNVRDVIFSSAKPVMNQLEGIKGHFFHSHKGIFTLNL